MADSFVQNTVFPDDIIINELPKMEKQYLNVPFEEKDEAKSLGAKFDWSVKRWYCPSDEDVNKFTKWLDRSQDRPPLSDEQQRFIDCAKTGGNILVDACIGSGKTMSIQALCDAMPDCKILYLTYNMLLKLDAQGKIHNGNTIVTNYHGFAYSMLHEIGIHVSPAELIQTFLSNLDDITVPEYDLLVIDEYQDIDLEISQMLRHIKICNPDIQIVAVGDMEQKIYDKTTLSVKNFIEEFLEDYTQLQFTKCFRLSADFAARLGKIWNKPIEGVNPDCSIEYMSVNEVIDLLSEQEPGDILCLGARSGVMTKVLNKLESSFPEKFNKNTVYASITDEDRENVRPGKNNAVFTTYDASKGLERKICVVFDCTEAYWQTRIVKPNTKYHILRNIFCVAMSRGKNKIVFVKDSKLEDMFISDETLSTPVNMILDYVRPFDASKMFDFKYKEDVDRCYKMLKIKEMDRPDHTEIRVKSYDGLIDLSPCIGKLQEAAFFDNYDVDRSVAFACAHNDSSFHLRPPGREATDEEKVLYITAIETDQARYVKQVKVPFVDDETLDRICDRLREVFDGSETVQQQCTARFIINHNKRISIDGMCDVMKNDIVYELKFVSELSHENFLQCAVYSIMFGLQSSVLWNIRNNKMYEVSVPDRDRFLKAVLRTVTKDTVKLKRLVQTTKPKQGHITSSLYTVST